MSEIPLGRIESEYGFNRYATAVSGAVQRTVRYHSSDIVRGYFDLVEEVRELLKIPATIFRVGDSDLKIIWLSGSPRMFPKIFRVEDRCDLSEKTYEEAKREIKTLSAEMNLYKVVFEYGREYKNSSGKGWSRGHDFESMERVSSPLVGLEELFNLPAESGINFEKEVIREKLEDEADLTAGSLKYTYINTDIGTHRARIPFLEEIGLRKQLRVEWTQIMFYKSR